MARLAAVEHQAAWLLHADADEFWWPTEGDLRSTLGALSPEIGLLSVARSNFLPGGDEEEPFFARMIVRDRSSVNALGQSLPPKVCHRGSADVIVAEGNHAAFSERLGPAMPTTKLEVLHYPARTYAQLERKVLHGARALDENRTLAADTGITWRWLRTELAEGRLQDYWAAQQRLGMRPDGDRYVRDERLKDYLLALQCQRNAG
jgi:hypothetical protein